MTRDEFWILVESIGWGTKTTDTDAVKVRLMRELTLEQANEAAKHLSAAEGELCKAVEDELGNSYCCDSWSDVLAHVVGLGRVEHDACVADPERLMSRYRAGKYTESFAYCWPYEDDYEKRSLSGFTRWIDGQIDSYTGAREPGFCEDDFATVLDALNKIEQGDVDAFLATEEAGRVAAEAIEQEYVRRARKYCGSCLIIDGGSVGNKWGIWNLYSDVRKYLVEVAA